MTEHPRRSTHSASRLGRPSAGVGGRNKAEPARLDAVLPATLEAMGLTRKLEELALLRLWPTVVPAPYQKTAIATRLQRRGNSLWLQVRVSDPLVASELGFQLGELTQKLNTYAPQTGITLAGIALQVR